MYILLFRSDDEPSICAYEDKAEALEGIKELNIPIENFCDNLDDGDIDFDKFPSNTAYLIKGELIVPTAKQVVTEIEIE